MYHPRLKGKHYDMGKHYGDLLYKTGEYLSSQSRFIRVAYTKFNSFSKEDEKSSVSQFFHILGSVD